MSEPHPIPFCRLLQQPALGRRELALFLRVAQGRAREDAVRLDALLAAIEAESTEVTTEAEEETP